MSINFVPYRPLVVRIIVGVIIANFFLAPASYAIAADLNFSSNTTLNLTGVSFSTLTIASGSTATSLTVGTTTFTVTVPSGGTFTVNASADITFSNTGSVSTTCGSTSSIAITGPVTSLIVTPTNSACPRARSSITASDLTPPPSPTNAKIVTTESGTVLTWIDPIASDFVNIVILRNSGGITPVSGDPYAFVEKGAQTFTDGVATRGVTYRYLIGARDTAGNIGLIEKALSITVPELSPIPSAKEDVPKQEEPKKEIEKKVEELKKEEPIKVEEKKVAEEKVPEVIIPAVSPVTITEETKTILSADVGAIARSAGRVADVATEQSVRQVAKFTTILSTTEGTQEKVAVAFIAYGTGTTTKLGEGERAGVLDSYRNAYGSLPETEEEWNDALLIAAGQTPAQENTDAEARAKALFKKLYKRSPVTAAVEGDGTVLRARENTDEKALAMLAYGVRPEVRDLAKEQKGIGAFKSVFHHDPKSAADWDAVRAIAYAGVAPP